ncbi:hypothetical protein [uncultured Fusobacterium sp.]|uniref:hypothetical protein n=1 Tax=uncultured Fusobacterium sp. TaxID=159267 RepID=UPI0025D27782|nr:hypothetical protein [uncultured Fusobacterium sp.]
MKKYEVANSLKNFLGKENNKILLKYSLEEKLSDEEERKLEKIYLENLQKQKKRIANKIKLENIEILISYVSYSYSENEKIYFENILEKNLRIFPNIKYFLLIYSKETEEIFKKIKVKFKNVDVNGILLEEVTSAHIQSNIQKYISKFKPNKNNSIIDITLGMKIITVYLYKLAVERGIFSINWQENQIPKYIYYEKQDEYIKDIGMRRYPFNTKLELMIEPEKENIKIYEYINKSLKKFEFSATESYYNQIGNSGMESFYRELSKIFSFQNMLSLDGENFYSQMENFFIKLSENRELSRENILKLKPFLSNLLSLILFESSEENIETRSFFWLDRFLTKFQIKSDELLENGFLSEYREKIYYFFILKYFESKKEEENSYYYEKFIKDLRKNILKELRVDEKEGKDFLRDGNIFELLDIDIEDIVENLNPSISLTESIKGDFYFENKVLYIEKYNLKIDCEKDERINFINNKGADILRELMKNYTVTFGGRELFERLAKYKNDESELARSNRFRKNLTVLKNKAKDFNNHLKEIGREEGIELGELILYQKIEEKESNYSHQFQINPKFYTLV